jgi:hypothetical protein
VRSIVIGKQGSEYVSIEIGGAPFEGWLTGTVAVSAGPWSGEFKAQFYVGELGRFGAEIEKLYQDLAGPAVFASMESNIEMTLTGDGKGHITAEGIARDGFVRDTYIRFELALDQTELPGIAAALRAADAE